MNENITFKNYTIKREDKRNWALTKTEPRIPKKDILCKKTGKVLHPAGVEYIATVKLGFFGEVHGALRGILKDYCGTGCSTIKDVLEQNKQLKIDLGLA